MHPDVTDVDMFRALNYMSIKDSLFCSRDYATRMPVDQPFTIFWGPRHNREKAGIGLWLPTKGWVYIAITPKDRPTEPNPRLAPVITYFLSDDVDRKEGLAAIDRLVTFIKSCTDHPCL